MPRFYQSLILIILASVSSYAAAKTTSSPRPAPPQDAQLKNSNVGAYLGIRSDVLPKELVAQMNEDIVVGQGILVTGFMPDSPAPKQGIQRYDILLKYDQTPLLHPKQFIQLIKHDKPGRKVKLTLSRKGKIMTLPVIMGSQNYPLNEDQLDYQYNLQVMGYDGIRIKQIRKNFYEATIRYLAPDGVVRRRTYRGWYGQVMQQVSASPDLSRVAKQSLMQAIKKHKDDEDGWFGDMMPFSDGKFF
jgi:hypothetical protein